MADAATKLVLTCTCGQRMKVPGNALGKAVTCVKCKTKVAITEDNTVPSAPPQQKPPPQAPKAPPPQQEQPPPQAAKAPAQPQEQPPPQAPKAPAQPQEQPRASSEDGEEPSYPPLEVDGSAVAQVLLESEIITEANLAEVRLVKKDLLHNEWELLVDLGHVSAEDFHAFMTKKTKVANIDLKNYEIPSDVIEFAPEDMVKRGLVFPIDRLGKLLTLGMACPIDTDTIEYVKKRTGLKIDAMLCNMDDLRATIKRHYPVKREPVGYGDPFGKEMAREFTEYIDDNEVADRIYDMAPMAPPSDTLERCKAAMQDPASALKEVTDVAIGDPIVALRLLTVSNSAAYGFAKRVDNLELACALLGAEAAATVLAAVDSVDYIKQQAGFDYEAMRNRARFCAKAAKAIATACESQRVIAAQTAGLLHEIGRMAFLAAAPNSYPVVSKGLAGEDLLAAEQRVYHTAHTELGYMRARKRNLPPAITEPIRFQGNPKEAVKSKEVVAIVALAARLAEAHGAGKKPSFQNIEFAFEHLDLKEDQVSAVFADLA